MVSRFAILVLILLAAGSACAESLTPDAARHFVACKLFAFSCFDGSPAPGPTYGDVMAPSQGPQRRSPIGCSTELSRQASATPCQAKCAKKAPNKTGAFPIWLQLLRTSPQWTNTNV